MLRRNIVSAHDASADSQAFTCPSVMCGPPSAMYGLPFCARTPMAVLPTACDLTGRWSERPFPNWAWSGGAVLTPAGLAAQLHDGARAGQRRAVPRH